MSRVLRPTQVPVRQVPPLPLPPPLFPLSSSFSPPSSFPSPSLSWFPCSMSPSSPTPCSLLPSLPPGHPQAPRRPEHPAKPISVKCHQRKHLRTSSYTCCRRLPGPPTSMQVSPWEERTHSGPWLVDFQPSSSGTAERKDRRREQSPPRCLRLREGHLMSFMVALGKLDGCSAA